MDKFIIRGGRPISGKVKVEGAKNAALPIISAALMISKGETILRNIPPLRDIDTIIDMLEHIGARVSFNRARRTLKINAENLTNNKAPYELMTRMRASFLVLGPILQRMGKAVVSLPGGCTLGPRPVDYHLKGFAALGADISEGKGYITATAKRLIGGPIYFDKPSHTGTENLMYGGVLAQGKTEIINAACDPEVVDLARFLNKAGAKITGAGTPNISITGVKKLKAVEYSVMGDRLEAGTFLMSAMATGGEIEVAGVETKSIDFVLNKLVEAGAEIKTKGKQIKLNAPKRVSPIDIVTFPFPGFPTDLQACIMAVVTKASGTSKIRETVFEDRFTHIMELQRLGGAITVAGNEAAVTGVKKLEGAAVMASDIRAGAGLLIACLSANGKSEISRIYHIDRGYYRIEEKLSALGADIIRTTA